MENVILARFFLVFLLILTPTALRSQDLVSDADIELAKEQLEAGEKKFGSNDPKTLELIDNLAKAYFQQGKYKKAEPLYLRVLKIRKRVLDPSETALLRSINSLGLLYHKQGRYGESEALYSDALSISEQQHGPDHKITLSFVNNLANLYETMGKYDEAEPFFVRVLEADEKNLGNEHRFTLGSISNLSGLYALQGRFGEAEPLKLRALDASRRTLGPNHPMTLSLTNNLAALYYEQGRFADVEPLFTTVLNSRKQLLGEEHPDTLGSLNNLAILYYELGRYDYAEQLQLEALRIRTHVLGSEHPDTLRSIYNLAAILGEQGRYDEAENLFIKARAAQERTIGLRHPDTLTTINDLAVFYRKRGRYSDAEPLFLTALIERAGTQGKDHIRVAETLSGIGLLIFESDRSPEKASFFLKNAINILQDVRQNMAELDSGTQQAFVDKWRETYLKLQQSLVAQGRFVEAETVGRMLKETEYTAFVRGEKASAAAKPVFLNKQEQAWETLLDSWQVRPNKLSSEIADMQKKQLDGATLSALESKQLADLEEAYGQSYAEFRTTIDGWLKDVRTKDNEDVQEEARALELASSERLQGVIADIGEDVALLQLVAFEDSLHMFLITPGAFKHVGVPVTRSNLFKTIFAARQEIDRGRDPNLVNQSGHKQKLRTQLGQLYDWLIKPLETELADAGTRTLMLNVQGEIRYVPFAALWDGNRWLTERYQLAIYTPAAQTVFAKPAAMNKGSAFGLSDATDGFSPLPAVRDELEFIMGDSNRAGVLQGTSALNDKFTRASLEVSLAAPAPILHIASHFAIRPGDEAASFLVLGDGSHLSVADMSRSSKLRFRGVELLTLSACETAIDGRGAGMELESIGALAQNKGAASVIATLWPVSDNSTPPFMRDFYEGVAKMNLSKAAAMQRAQIRMIGSQLDNHPFYWAPFILMGNWR